jgi:hypothetical protein
MKKIVLMMVALLSMTAVQAQESDKKQEQQFRGPKQVTPEQMTERMTNDLKLTDEQKTKVLALNKEYEKVIAGSGMRGPRPGRGNGEAQEGQQRPERPQLTDEQREQLRKEMQERMKQREEYEQKLKEILTDDQYKQYQESRPRRRGFGGRGHGRHGGFGGQGGPRPQF